MFATIALARYDDLPDLISVSTPIYHHIRMHQYDSNCTFRTNLSDLTGIPSVVFIPAPVNAFESIEAMLEASFEEEPLEAYFWEQSTVPSPWNTYWRDAAREGGRRDINDPVFGPQLTRYTGEHSSFPCDPQEPCDCERHNCAGTHSTIEHAAAAATAAKSLRIALIVVVPMTPTASEIDAYNWHW
jgi:hypothetical protein